VFVRTLLKTEFANPGYNPAHVVFFDFELPVPSILRQHSKTPSDNQKYAEAAKAFLERRALFNRRLLQKAKSSPDFAAVSMTDCLPFSSVHTYVIARENYPQADQARWISRAAVSLGYFQTVGIPLLHGRYFDERDSVSAPRAAIVCESMARLLWPGKNPIGEYLSFYWPGSTYPPQWMEVVGVVKEVKPVLSDGGSNPFVYTPIEQQTNHYARSLVAKGSESPAQMIKSLRTAVREADPAAEITRSRTMTEAIGEILYPRRMAFEILAVSGLIGLFLASVGIYGVVSYSVAQRIREIGIRAALGAQKRDIMKLVIGEGIKVSVMGSVLGIVLAFAATRLASSFVVAIPAMDWITFITVPLVLGTVVLLACYIPARSAARVDPMVALREL
jgi:putative ABC transport system permease protein